MLQLTVYKNKINLKYKKLQKMKNNCKINLKIAKIKKLKLIKKLVI